MTPLKGRHLKHRKEGTWKCHTVSRGALKPLLPLLTKTEENVEPKRGVKRHRRVLFVKRDISRHEFKHTRRKEQSCKGALAHRKST